MLSFGLCDQHNKVPSRCVCIPLCQLMLPDWRGPKAVTLPKRVPLYIIRLTLLVWLCTKAFHYISDEPILQFFFFWTLDFGLSRLTSLQFIQYHVTGFCKPTKFCNFFIENFLNKSFSLWVSSSAFCTLAPSHAEQDERAEQSRHVDVEQSKS
jgi:hypothetical protein